MAVAAAFAAPVHADEETDHWFNNGIAYYEHPCGWDAFIKYGKLDTPENRHNYVLTRQHPELCSKLFP
jgi:hypothetical protein